jgi:O-antigen/teichoic acid export membrane protein
MSLSDVVARLRLSTFWRNIVSNAGGHAIGALLQIALILILPRILTVGEFAAYVTALALVAVAEMASDFGGRIWATRRFALGSQPADTFLLALGTKTVFSALFGLAVGLLPFNALQPQDVAIALAIAFLQPSTDPILWFLRGRERLDAEAGAVLAWRLVTASSTFGLASAGAGVTAILLAWLAGSVLRVVCEVAMTPAQPVFVGLRAAAKAVTGRRLLETFQECAPLGFAFVVMALFQRLGVFLLGETGSKQDVANYGLAFTLAASAGFLATSVTVSSFPALAKMLEMNDMTGAESVVRRKLQLIALMILPVCVAGILAGPVAIGWAYPKEYWPAAEVLVWLLPGLFMSTMNFALKYLLNALGLNWRDALTACIGVLAFPLVAFLPHWPSAVLGAAFAWTASETLVFAGKWFVLRRDGRLPLGINGFYLAAGIAFWALTLAVASDWVQAAFQLTGRTAN